jgi:hypothetical protein
LGPVPRPTATLLMHRQFWYLEIILIDFILSSFVV